MLLVCDIGNSRIKTGIFQNDKITSLKNFDEVNSLLDFYSNKNISEAVVSSVVPVKLNMFKKQWKSLFDSEPSVIDINSNFNLKIDYETPETLGIDRICSAEGAFYIYKKQNEYKNNAIIVSFDFGTATTINIIEYDGIFSGGLIAPGIEMMFSSLNDKTAQLPKVNIDDYLNFIGKSTKGSIASGVLNSIAGLIEKTISYLELKRKAEVKIFITGGNADNIIPYLNFNYCFEKSLVLYGIKSVYDNSLKNNFK